MDSKQLVNDIVNKRLSKAKKTINEELSNHVLKHIERKKSDVINEAVGFSGAGLAAAGLAGAGLAGVGIVKGAKALAKRFSASGRLKAATDKEEKKGQKAQDKYDLAYKKGPGKTIKKLEAKKHRPGRGVSLTDKEQKFNDKIDAQIVNIQNKFDDDWAKSHKKDIKAGRVSGEDGETLGKQSKTKQAKKAKKAKKKAEKKSKEDETEEEELTDEEKEAQALENEKTAVKQEINKRTTKLQKTKAEMNIKAILGKDASEKENQNLASQEDELGKLDDYLSTLEPSEEGEEEVDEE